MTLLQVAVRCPWGSLFDTKWSFSSIWGNPRGVLGEVGLSKPELHVSARTCKTGCLNIEKPNLLEFVSGFHIIIDASIAFWVSLFQISLQSGTTLSGEGDTCSSWTNKIKDKKSVPIRRRNRLDKMNYNQLEATLRWTLIKLALFSPPHPNKSTCLSLQAIFLELIN